jgi:flavin-dependent dehydrogenase
MEMFRNPYPCEYDVIVAGGGPAGIAAAVSAARQGAKTALIERYGILGGMLTSGHVQPILGRAQGRTMYNEIVELLSEGHENVPKVVTRNGAEIGLDLEEAKYRLLKLCVDNGVYVYLQTTVADVLMEENRVAGVKVCTPMGLQELKAKVVVDSTGDGLVAALAGAPFEMGRPSDGKCQPVTLEFTVDNVDESIGITAWGGSDPVPLPNGTKFSQACKDANARGELPENVTIVRLHRTINPG